MGYAACENVTLPLHDGRASAGVGKSVLGYLDVAVHLLHTLGRAGCCNDGVAQRLLHLPRSSLRLLIGFEEAQQNTREWRMNALRALSPLKSKCLKSGPGLRRGHAHNVEDLSKP